MRSGDINFGGEREKFVSVGGEHLWKHNELGYSVSTMDTGAYYTSVSLSQLVLSVMVVNTENLVFCSSEPNKIGIAGRRV